MSRLYDRIILDRNRIQELVKSPVVVIDNVITYCFATLVGKDIGADFPGLKMPFQTVFLEGNFGNGHSPLRRAGVMLHQISPPVVYGILFLEVYKSIDRYLAFSAQLTDSGVYYQKFVDNWGKELTLTREDLSTSVYQLLYPIWMALELMNCKNVELVDNPPPPKLSARHKKDYGEPLVTYKTIKVNSMRTLKHYTDLDAEDQPCNTDPANMPLHIARGHFKDYRDGKGLFGKLKGIYWWDMHVRGSIENGAVIKDYDVLSPKETN